MTLTLMVEIVVAVLLLVTLAISLVLNRRLGNLRANQDEMRRLIGDFDKALTKARQGLAELKTASATTTLPACHSQGWAAKAQPWKMTTSARSTAARNPPRVPSARRMKRGSVSSHDAAVVSSSTGCPASARLPARAMHRMAGPAMRTPMVSLVTMRIRAVMRDG